MSWSETIRKLISSRALGRCEYCLLDQADAGFPHQIDHVTSRKHGGLDHPDNLALACYLCNRYKGSDIASIHPQTGDLIRLFHPRLDLWTEHFCVDGAVIEPLTDVAVVTTQLLRINAPARVIERQLLQSLDRYPKR